MLAAVVARPDPKWGETPCAFLELKPGATQPDDKELIAFCQARLARFKVPKGFCLRHAAEDIDREDTEIRAP
jgi:fatty-acyl-CoA synthase